MSAEFMLTTLIVVITPGTGVVCTMAAGLSRGMRASVIAAAGWWIRRVFGLAFIGLAARLVFER